MNQVFYTTYLFSSKFIQFENSGTIQTRNKEGHRVPGMAASCYWGICTATLTFLEFAYQLWSPIPSNVTFMARRTVLWVFCRVVLQKDGQGCEVSLSPSFSE